MSQELQVIERNPKNEVKFGQEAANHLMNIVREKGLAVKFIDKKTGKEREHLEVEAWELLGQFAGIWASADDAEPCEVHGIQGARARVSLRDFSGAIVGGAIAYCMRDEPNWNYKPWFQLASMAQTRATSKAFRLRLAWIARLAGYSGTPAEEMDGIDPPQESQPAKPVCPKCGNEKSVIAGKPEYGGGWVCYTKKAGGCGHKWQDVNLATEFATADQLTEIESLAPKAGVGIMKILEKYKVGTLSMLTKEQADAALHKLADLVAKKQAE